MALLIKTHEDPRPWIDHVTITTKATLDIHVRKAVNNRTLVTLAQGCNSICCKVSDIDDLIEALKLIKERGV